MRRFGPFKPALHRNAKGVVCVISLGADFCAEHEWGISDIHYHFGCPAAHPEQANSEGVYGFPRYNMTEVGMESVKFGVRGLQFGSKDPDHVEEPDDTKHKVAHLLYQSYWYPATDAEEPAETRVLEDALRIWSPDDELVTAWSGRDFGIRLLGPDCEQILGRFYDAIKTADFALWTIGSPNPFARGGMAIGIPSLIDDEHVQEMFEADRKTQLELAESK